MEDRRKINKLVTQAIKIAIGSCAAIYIAEGLHLQNAAAAGIITLLTILTTKWETLFLSVFRIATFGITVVLCSVIFQHVSSEWFAFGLFLLILVTFSELVGWKSTISVNAVIGTHFLIALDFSWSFIVNELLLVLIGISIAILLNLIQNNKSHKSRIMNDMRYTEERLKTILEELATYLQGQPMRHNVWDDIRLLEQKLQSFIEHAYDYQNNTIQSHPEYYINYFEMRMKQCNILHNLHYEIKKIRNLPIQATIIAEYISYLAAFVIEKNVPTKQIKRLEELIEDMKKQPLPKTQDEFESRAMLYHILMDIEDFLIYKRRFIESLDETQLKIYWNRTEKKNIQSAQKKELN